MTRVVMTCAALTAMMICSYSPYTVNADHDDDGKKNSMRNDDEEFDDVDVDVVETIRYGGGGNQKRVNLDSNDNIASEMGLIRIQFCHS
eukprot:g4219.t1